MPASRQRSQQTLSTSLAAHVRRQTPVNILPLSYYYRSGHFLLRQVKSLSCNEAVKNTAESLEGCVLAG